MHKHFWESRLLKSLKQRDACLLLVVSLLGLTLLQAFALWAMAGRWHVVVSPPTITKSFWVSHNQVSDEYLSEMSLYFASLLLDVTPESTELNHKMLLQYTDPSGYGSLRAQLVARAERLKAQDMSTVFYPVDIQTNPQTLIVQLQGDIKTMVGQQVINTTRQYYQMQYTYHQGRLLVKSFDEVAAHEN
jgi:conjugal transfer pilus assembly protein TraE